MTLYILFSYVNESKNWYDSD